MALGEWFVDAATVPGGGESGGRRCGGSVGQTVRWAPGANTLNGVDRKAEGGVSENDKRGGSVFPLSWGEGGGVIAAWRL